MFLYISWLGLLLGSGRFEGLPLSLGISKRHAAVWICKPVFVPYHQKDILVVEAVRVTSTGSICSRSPVRFPNLIQCWVYSHRRPGLCVKMVIAWKTIKWVILSWNYHLRGRRFEISISRISSACSSGLVVITIWDVWGVSASSSFDTMSHVDGWATNCSDT